MVTTVGQLVAGRYRLVQPLAAGGMGGVWLAHDEFDRDDPVAIKKCAIPAGLTADEQDLFRVWTVREARAFALVGHPNVVRTLDERGAWHPEQAVSVERALEATILAPAWLARDERRRGKLVPGYLADLVVLDRDPVAIEPDELPEVQVVATMLGGRWVHNPPPWG